MEALALLLLLLGLHDDRPVVMPNDMARPAGVMHGDTLVVSLAAGLARWQPDTLTDRWLDVAAFREAGGAPSIPGPLLRVPAGGHIALTLRNDFNDTLVMIGLGRHYAAGFVAGDSLVVGPHETGSFVVTVEHGGTTPYYAETRRGGKDFQLGVGRQLVGVLQVGVPRAGERLFALNVFEMLLDSSNAKSDVPLWAINGRMWPSTERLAYDIGDTVRWRIVDLSFDEHPMHLHGFFYTVDGRSTWTTDSMYAPDDRRLVVTEPTARFGSYAMTWVPRRAGAWLFHCHKAPHMGPDSRMTLMRDTTTPVMSAHLDPAQHMRTGMSGLILGIHVRGTPRLADTRRPAQRIRLLIQRRPHVFDTTEGYGYVWQRGGEPAADSIEQPGSVLTLTRDSLTEITVVNHLPYASTIHWHGMELDSYYDGVGGWSGAGSQIAPMLAPGDSFIVRMRPPRAGTFIYHTHVSEGQQMFRGLVGALLVLEPGQRYDPATDHVILIHEMPSGDSTHVVANARWSAAPITVTAGVRQRLRFITMIIDDAATITLTPDSTPATWRAIAKDGANLPPSQATIRPAVVHLTPGETYDAEFTPTADTMALAVSSHNSFRIPIVVR